jgi:hypothetical protein
MNLSIDKAPITKTLGFSSSNGCDGTGGVDLCFRPKTGQALTGIGR